MKEVNINTPKVGYSGETGNTPGAFNIKVMTMTNSRGQTKDLRKLIDSFTITAELFSPVITLSATIRDNGDFFIKDKFDDICGQEKIEIEIEPLGKVGDAIHQIFFVKEYVNYTKTLDFPNTQIYSLIAISEFAYRSSLMNICRVVDKNKTTDKNIETIFKDDLGLEEFIVYGDPVTKFEGIINIQRPLKAAEWLRSRCFEENGMPFFLHGDVTKKSVVYLSSWKYLNESAVMSEFKYRQFSKEKPGSPKHTEEERTRILSMTSNIKFDRLSSANAGAYSSRLNVTDYASKSYYTLDFKTKPTTEPATYWTPQKYKIKNREGSQEETTLHNIPSASIASVHVNTAVSPDGAQNSTTAALAPYITFSNAFNARLSEINHEIVVYGDTALNPGTKVTLEIPKALRESTKFEIDPVVSGTFIVVVAAHIFSNGIYTNKLKLVRLTSVELSDNTTLPSVSVNANIDNSSIITSNSPTLTNPSPRNASSNQNNTAPLPSGEGIDVDAPSLLPDLPGDQPPSDAVPLILP